MRFSLCLSASVVSFFLGATMKRATLSLAAWAARVLPGPVKRAIYRAGPLAKAIRGTLNRAAPGGLSEARVAAGGLEGLPLLLDMHTEKDYWLGTYEPELQATLRHEVHPGMVVYDVGANIGYVSLLFARAVAPTGRVFAFEALPANVERIRANLALNPDAAVTVVGKAVVETSRAVEFLTHASGAMGKAAGSAGREDQVYGAALRVEGISLDEFIYTQLNPLPQVVKVDIEGGEVLALPGMRRLLREAGPLVLLELHGPAAAKAAWDELTAAGYALYKMQDGERIPSLAELDWKAYVVGRK
jgi:FkbM family methyltransferase